MYSPIVCENNTIISMGDLLSINNRTILNHATNKEYIINNEELMETILDSCDKITDKNTIEEKEGYYIPESLFLKYQQLGIISDDGIRDYNIGTSDYSKHVIQPWSIWIDYDLNPWDADIVKRVLRTKSEKGISAKESRILDYEKIIHICKERIRQLTLENE